MRACQHNLGVIPTKTFPAHSTVMSPPERRERLMTTMTLRGIVFLDCPLPSGELLSIGRGTYGGGMDEAWMRLSNVQEGQ